MKRNLYVGATILALAGGLGVGSIVLGKKAVVQAAGVQAPRFEVDPMWPKPLPNHWILGNVIGVSVDSRDHIWIIHRQDSPAPKEVYASTTPPGAECCLAAPPVLEFDEEGNLLAHWGGQGGEGYEWPGSNHGIFVDYKGNVWIGGNGRVAVGGGPDGEMPAAPGGRGKAGKKGGGAAPPAPGGPPLYHDSMVMK